MNSNVFRQLGVEGCGEQAAGADEDWVAAACRQRFDARPDAGDAWRTDENHFERTAWKGRRFSEDGGFILATVRVAFYSDVKRAERFLGGVGDVAREQDGSGTGAEDGLFVDEVGERREEVIALEKFQDGRGLAAWDDEAVEAV